MRILTLAQFLTPSDGWGTSAGNTVRGLIDRGHEVLSLVQKEDKSLPFPQRAVLPAAQSLAQHPLLLWKTARALKAAVKEFKPDIINFSNEPYAFAAILPGMNKLPPMTMTACGTYSVLPLMEWKTRWMMKRVYATLSHIFAISRYTDMRVMKAVESVSPSLAQDVRKKMNVWTLGIVQPLPPPPRGKHTEKRILFVGAVKPRKGPLEAIEACAAFKKRSSVPFRFDIVGALSPGGYSDLLKRRTKELGLEQNVLFRGHISDQELTQCYADADCFMMLSKSHGHHFEGYGLVFLEANARGTPVVGPLDSGCENAIADGRSGYLVHPSNADDVAERLQWILEENRIKPEECKTWAKEHSVERQAEEAEAVYQKLTKYHFNVN